MSANRHGTATRGDVLVNELNDGVSLEDGCGMKSSTHLRSTTSRSQR